jgi:hypothetical protein
VRAVTSMGSSQDLTGESIPPLQEFLESPPLLPPVSQVTDIHGILHLGDSLIWDAFSGFEGPP